jgi:hypothetical protein
MIVQKAAGNPNAKEKNTGDTTNASNLPLPTAGPDCTALRDAKDKACLPDPSKLSSNTDKSDQGTNGKKNGSGLKTNTAQ